MSKIVGNTGNAASQFFFAYEFWVVLAHVPDNRWDIIHTLVVGDNNQGPIYWKLMAIGKSICSTQKIGCSHQGPIKNADSPFYALITKYSMAKPNNRMKKEQRQAKGYEKDRSK